MLTGGRCTSSHTQLESKEVVGAFLRRFNLTKDISSFVITASGENISMIEDKKGSLVTKITCYEISEVLKHTNAGKNGPCTLLMAEISHT